MSVTTVPPPPPMIARRSALLQLTLVELKLLVRERGRLVIGIGLPVVLLIIFGSIPAFKTPRATYGGLSLFDEYIPVLITFTLALLALSFVPVILAGYREKGILRRLQTTPAGPVRVLVAQLGASVVLAVIRVVVVVVVARLGYHVPLARQFGGFVIYVLLTILALLAVGLFIAAVAPNGRIALAIGISVLYLLMFFAGLWLPIPSMPSVLQHISHATPLGAAVTALQDTADGRWPPVRQLLTLIAYTVGFGLVAARLFRWG